MKGVLVFIAAVVSSTVAHAECDATRIDGQEDNNNWTVQIDVRKGTFFQTLNSNTAHTRHGNVSVDCTPNLVTMAQTWASDGNLCNFRLNRSGGNVSGTYTCTLVPGNHVFTGIIR
jgi:hypothetical protein